MAKADRKSFGKNSRKSYSLSLSKEEKKFISFTRELYLIKQGIMVGNFAQKMVKKSNFTENK